MEDRTHTHAAGRDTDLHLVVRGSLVGTALADLGQLLEGALQCRARRVYLDLSEVHQWSLLAQAMVLETARRLAERGARLVLTGPTAALREQSRRLDVFHRVPTVPSASTSPPTRRRG